MPLPHMNDYLEFLLSDHPAAEQVRLWWRLCDRHDPEYARRFWLALRNPEGHPLEAAAGAWAVRDRLEVTRARVVLEEVARRSIDPRYRYPTRYLGRAAEDQEVLLEVDPDRPLPSPEAEIAERHVADRLATARS